MWLHSFLTSILGGKFFFSWRTEGGVGVASGPGLLPVHSIRVLDFLVAVQSVAALYCSRVPAANAPGCTAAEGLLYKP